MTTNSLIFVPFQRNHKIIVFHVIDISPKLHLDYLIENLEFIKKTWIIPLEGVLSQEIVVQFYLILKNIRINCPSISK